jgi:serine/threonine-protein kinase
MAPEQFHGRAVFASDIYSLGVTMYQMVTGTLPYETPSPADIEKLKTGELVTAPRIRNPQLTKAVNDIILRAMAPDPIARYQRAGDLLNDLLAERGRIVTRRTSRTPTPPAGMRQGNGSGQDIQSRLRARETPQPRFCWHCRKPLHARSDRCPFCGEAQ